MRLQFFFAVFIVLVICMIVCNQPLINSAINTVHRVSGSLQNINMRQLTGPFLVVKWTTPEKVMYYRAFLSNDSAKLAEKPFDCHEVHCPHPTKAGERAKMLVMFKREAFDYNLYMELFAFDIDGNYFNVEPLEFIQ